MPNGFCEERLDGAGGLKIFVRSWHPEGRPRGVVAICHGLNSHSGYYFWAAEQLVAHGLAVYAVDLRGCGRSDGERCYVERFDEYLSDLDLLVGLARSRETGSAIFLLGHSVGGVISCVYALSHQQELAGLICESFAFQIPASSLTLAFVEGLSRLAPHSHMLKLAAQRFSRDPSIVEVMTGDPLLAHEIQPTRTIAEIARADRRLKRAFPSIRLPVLIIHGTADAVARARGSQVFYDQAGSSDKTLKLYAGYYHDPLNDVGKETVLSDIREWIEERLPAA